MKNGILLMDKPSGFTSHDVVAKARGILKTKKIGHSGTLDPMVTGVLPLFIGSATKACDRMPNHDKSYTATLKLGISTDTQDITGDTLETKKVEVGLKQVEEILSKFKGEIFQIPPMYSAVHVNGQRLYELARQGKVVERPARQITVYDIQLLHGDEDLHEYIFTINCSKGTYVRTICHDIGEMLGCGGTLKELCRTSSSGFLLQDCYTFAEIEALMAKNEIDQHLIPVDTVFKSYPKVILTEELEKYYKNGVSLWLGQLETPLVEQWVRLYNKQDVFLGIGKIDLERNQLTQQQQF